MKRLSLVLVLGLVLGACGTFEEEPAAIVRSPNGEEEEITDAALQSELDDVEDSEAYRIFLEQQQLQRTFAGSGQGTVSTPFVAALLTDRIYFTILEQELDDPPSQARLDEARRQVDADNTELLAGLPGEQRNDLVRRVATLIALQEDLVPAYFDENQADFDTLCVSHVLVGIEERSPEAAEARAEDLRQQLEDGASFRRLARTQSDDTAAAAESGDLGCFVVGGGQFVPEFEEAAARLDAGEISDPVRTEFGSHLIRVRERTPSPLEDVDDAVRQRLVTGLIQDARVTVDPRYGRWDERGDGGFQVVAPSEGGEAEET